MSYQSRFIVLCIIVTTIAGIAWCADAGGFEGRFVRGRGDSEYLELLDISRRMFGPDCEYQNLAMLYMPDWNGLVEGPTWDAWWIQNSYGTTYCVLPFLREPFMTFLQNSQDLWFDQMGDGKRVGASPPFDWVAPDGALCDAARPGWIVYRQGDGRVRIHDWGMEFTAAGIVLQAELLLINRDPAAIGRYLPKLERCVRFIETRRDPKNNLFLAGPAGNLLAPSYAGWKKPDGTFGQAYLAGLSITYIAALDRMIELEKLAERAEQATVYSRLRDAAREGLKLLSTGEGYFVRSVDPDGTRHGVYGAGRHGYFEASPNHDAVAFGVVDDDQAKRIYDKIASVPGLRPHRFIIANYPSYDDMYEEPHGLWGFGTWVNGGHWSTCEARMILGYYRVAAFEDARGSMKQLLSFARRFRMDNPLVKFGSDVYQPGQPINLTYDAFGPPAAMIRGLFEYLYRADHLELRPHIPPTIAQLHQAFPVRFGAKQIYLGTVGVGPVTSVSMNGKAWSDFDSESVRLPYDRLPETATIEIALGGAGLQGMPARAPAGTLPSVPANDDAWNLLRRPNLSVNNLPLRIGADSEGGSRFIGAIADVGIHSRALSEEEIAAAANRRGVPGVERSLVAAWSFGRASQGDFSPEAGSALRATRAGEVRIIAGPDRAGEGERGAAIELDGKGFLEFANDPSLGLTDAITISARIRPSALPPGGGRIVDKSQVGTSNGYLLDTHPGNSLRLISQAGTISHDARLVPGEWVHVAGTVSADGHLRLFINGRMVAEKAGQSMSDVSVLIARAERIARFHRLLAENGLAADPVAAHARLAIEALATAHERLRLLKDGVLKALDDPVSQAAADRSYVEAASKLIGGLSRQMEAFDKSAQSRQQQIVRLWRQTE